MLPGRRYLFIFLFILIRWADLFAQTDKPLVGGIALGYPPYQFTNAAGAPVGIDAEVTRLVFLELGRPFQFMQKSWDDIYFGLAHDVGEVDFLCGTEVNPERMALFDFSQPYYNRVVVIFVKADSPYQRLDDLEGKVLTGDRGGVIERLIDRKKLRVMNTQSKEAAFQKLKSGEVEAVTAPLEVGHWITKRMGLMVRILPEKDTGSPVAFAVAKGNTALARQISTALVRLRKRGAIEAVLKKYK